MKKLSIYLLVVLSVFVFAGCTKENGGTTTNKKLTCTREETDENGYTLTENLVIEYNNTKVIKSTSTITQEVLAGYAEKAVNAVTSFEESVNKLKGISVNYEATDDSHYQVVFKVEFDKVDLDQVEEAFGEYYDEDSYYNKPDITIDEFKEEYLEEYECK